MIYGSSGRAARNGPREARANLSAASAELHAGEPPTVSRSARGKNWWTPGKITVGTSIAVALYFLICVALFSPAAVRNTRFKAAVDSVSFPALATGRNEAQRRWNQEVLDSGKAEAAATIAILDPARAGRWVPLLANGKREMDSASIKSIGASSIRVTTRSLVSTDWTMFSREEFNCSDRSSVLIERWDGRGGAESAHRAGDGMRDPPNLAGSMADRVVVSACLYAERLRVISLPRPRR